VLHGTTQTCGLYGANHDHETKVLADIEPGTVIRVRGILGADRHRGGSDENPSPWGESWMIYMDVHEAEVVAVSGESG